jgi:hypothetical protein
MSCCSCKSFRISRPLSLVLGILERVRIKSVVVLKIRAADGPTAFRLLGLADIQCKSTPFSLCMCLNLLAVSLCSLTAVFGLLFVVDTMVYHFVCLARLNSYGKTLGESPILKLL